MIMMYGLILMDGIVTVCTAVGAQNLGSVAILKQLKIV